MKTTKKELDGARQVSGDHQGGFSLVEVTMALAVFTITALSASFALLSSMDHREQSFDRYRVLVALREKVAEIQNFANEPDDLTQRTGISSVYVKYHDTTSPIPDVENGTIHITCYADENNVPTRLGGIESGSSGGLLDGLLSILSGDSSGDTSVGIMDLNLDLDASDILDNQSAGTDLKLVPMELTATFDEHGTPSVVKLHRLITKTVD